MRRRLKYSHSVRSVTTSDWRLCWMAQCACFVLVSLDKIAELCYTTLSDILYMSHKIHNINLSLQWNIIISQQLQLRLLRKESTEGHAIFFLSEKVKHINRSPVLDSQKTKCTKITITNILLLFKQALDIYHVNHKKAHEDTASAWRKLFKF